MILRRIFKRLLGLRELDETEEQRARRHAYEVSRRHADAERRFDMLEAQANLVTRR